MTYLDKIRNVVGLGKEEYVVQLFDSDSRRWIDEGMSDDTTEPEEYGFDDSDAEKRRKICRKGSKTKDILWVVGGKKRKRARKTNELGKNKSPIDAISTQAQKIKRDQEKLVEIRDVIGDLLGDGAATRDEEWMYPSMAKGLNRGLGHAFMVGMDGKKDEIASAGLEMVNGISNIMSSIPIIAVAIAKSQGVNVGIFGVDEDGMFGRDNGAKQPEKPAEKPSDIIHERPDGFDVNTSGEEEPIPDEGIDEDDEEELVDDITLVSDDIVEEGDFDDEELVNEIPLPMVGDDQ